MEFDLEKRKHVKFFTKDVTISPLQKGCTGTVIRLNVPDGHLLTVLGTINISAQNEYGFHIRAMDVDNKEVSLDTKIEVRKFYPQSQMFQCMLNTPHYVLYKHVSSDRLYSFAKNYILKGGQHIQWIFKNPDVDIINVEFIGMFDMWENSV